MYFFLLCLVHPAYGPMAEGPDSGARQTGWQTDFIYIVGATAHLGQRRGARKQYYRFHTVKTVLIHEKLTLVRTPENLGQVNLSRYKVIDAKGKHVYPGFISLNSGLPKTWGWKRSVRCVWSTRDSRETGLLNPSVRSLVAYNTDSEVIPTIRARGVLMAQIVPEAEEPYPGSPAWYTLMPGTGRMQPWPPTRVCTSTGLPCTPSFQTHPQPGDQ